MKATEIRDKTALEVRLERVSEFRQKAADVLNEAQAHCGSPQVAGVLVTIADSWQRLANDIGSTSS